MKKLVGVLLMLLVVGNVKSFSQSDSLKAQKWEEKKQEFKKSLYIVLPLGAAGAISKTKNNFFSNSIFQDFRNDRFPNFDSRLDDYLAVAPVAAVFTTDIISRKSRHNFFNQVVILVKSELLMSAIVFPIKAWSKQLRPDGSNDQSFPSGHTAQAFVSATFLHKEYGEQSIWYTIGGYTAASTVGIYRVLNNQHFVSDILVGAAIGILSTNFVYLTHQNKWGKKKNVQAMILPTYLEGKLGLNFAMRF